MGIGLGALTVICHDSYVCSTLGMQGQSTTLALYVAIGQDKHQNEQE